MPRIPIPRTIRLPRRGFTLIETMVAVSLLAMLSSLAAVNVSTKTRDARNARRKSDVSSYAKGLELYRLSHKNYFVQDPAGCEVDSGTGEGPLNRGSGGCVGAAGRSYGMMNFKNGTASGAFTRTYGAKSIADVLRDGGYLSTASRDPLVPESRPVAASDPDYVLVRCCAGGIQNASKRGSLYAIWTRLEGGATAEEVESSSRYCGGDTAGRNAYKDSFQVEDGFQYDFGGPFTVDSRAYAVGNSAPVAREGSACGPVALDR